MSSGGSEAVPSLGGPGAVGVVDLGPLCPADFKVRPEAARVFGEVAQFAAPPIIQDLFQRVSASDMLRMAEANAARVSVRLFLI